MSEVLDEIEKIKDAKKIFSRISFGFAVIAIIFLIYAFTQIPSDMRVADIGKPLPQTFIYANFAAAWSVLFGTIMAIISFVRKEHESFLKWVSSIFNIVSFIFYVGRLILHLW